MRLHNIFGGLNRGATRALHALSKGATDRTAYESWAAPEFQPYWGQRISASIVMTDAKRRLQRHEHATGLDTGCCYGGELTALVLPEWRLVAVDAGREYTVPGG